MAPRDRALRAMVLALTAAALLATVAWVWLALDVERLRLDLADLHARRELLDQKGEHHAALSRGLRHLDDFIETTGRAIESPRHAPDIAASVARQLAELEAADFNVTTADADEHGPFPTIDISATAGSPELFRVLRRIERAPAILRPARLSLVAPEAGSPVVHAELSIEMIADVEGEHAAGGAP